VPAGACPGPAVSSDLHLSQVPGEDERALPAGADSPPLHLVRLSLYLQVFDVCLLVPALALLFLLIYTSPRCREKLSGSSLLVLALHLSTWATTAILLFRALLTIGTASLCLTSYVKPIVKVAFFVFKNLALRA
jgi:hypothetical protein